LENSVGGTGADLLFDDAAVEHVDGAFGVAGEAGVVRDHHDRGAAAVEVGEERHDGVAVFRIEVAGGLVGEEDGGEPARARATATRCCWPPESWEGRCLERWPMPTFSRAVVTAVLALGGGHAAVGEGELDVFVDGEVADEVEGLENEADLAVADAGALGEREALDGAAVEEVGAVGRGVEQAEDGEEGGFAAAGGAGDGDVFALGGCRGGCRRGRGSRLRR
jgi:hypothetical protein